MPQAKASKAGATPKVITSARESSSLPNSLTAFVIRAMRPSIPSVKMATPIAIAAKSNIPAACANCSGGRTIAWIVFMIA